MKRMMMLVWIGAMLVALTGCTPLEERAASRSAASPSPSPTPSESSMIQKAGSSLATAIRDAGAALDEVVDSLESFDNLDLNLGNDLSELASIEWDKLSGHSFDRGITTSAIDSKIQEVRITNRNGRILLKRGEVSEVQAALTVVVDHVTKEEAKTVADKAQVEINRKGKTLEIHTTAPSYGKRGQYEPSLLLTVTLPEKTKAALAVEQANGVVDARNAAGTESLSVTVRNGSIEVREALGALVLEMENGRLEVNDAKEAVTAKVTNGEITARGIKGPLVMKAVNGRLSAKDVFSSVEAEVAAGVVTLESETLGGDWSATSEVGTVSLSWPANASVAVEGEVSIGGVKTDFPLTVSKGKATGTIGKGTYKVKAKAFAGLRLEQVR
ncbi:DUF4097 family beta strand repeat-containing protein [Gorillibacterium sp. CAU 1737]|uniref:DUF4097 family beta strand repeat-containing protein n=1 Tax=Gorillibacterium sp. CAU 1737 TaxID=3140362 RepID=UPI0032600C7D